MVKCEYCQHSQIIHGKIHCPCVQCVMSKEKIEQIMGISKKEKPPRKYYRKCGACGTRYEQSEMVRTERSTNGWLCLDCYNG